MDDMGFSSDLYGFGFKRREREATTICRKHVVFKLVGRKLI